MYFNKQYTEVNVREKRTKKKKFRKMCYHGYVNKNNDPIKVNPNK